MVSIRALCLITLVDSAGGSKVSTGDVAEGADDALKVDNYHRLEKRNSSGKIQLKNFEALKFLSHVPLSAMFP